MKHLIRKPMLAILLLAVTVFGTGFMAFFQADIAAGWAQIDRLYNETQITVELVPEAGWSNLQMKTHKSMIIEGMPEIAQTLSVMECSYVLHGAQPIPEPLEGMEESIVETSTIHGTNNLPWLAEAWGLRLHWHGSWSADTFTATEALLPCLVRQELLDAVDAVPGDTITVSPTHLQNMLPLGAKQFQLLIVGSFEDSLSRTGKWSVLVPEEGFLEGPRLLYNSNMMYRCYYRAYAMKLNPEYNREYDRIENELEEILYDLHGYSFASNAQALENATRPLAQKLQMQEMLVAPMAVLLCAAAVIIAVLLGMGMATEVFLRLMWGEKRLGVLLRLGGTVCLWLVICVTAACGVSCLTAGAAWLGWAAQYSAATGVLCLCGCAVPLLKYCFSNLVKSYQSREGD